MLLLTLYASQYSGNSLFGFTGMTYRIGYAWVMSVHFMIAIVIFYQLIAVRLFRLCRDRGYITPVDFIQDRFQNKAISLIAAIVMIVALSNFLLAQLMAMGRAMQGLAGAHVRRRGGAARVLRQVGPPAVALPARRNVVDQPADGRALQHQIHRAYSKLFPQN